MKKVILLTMVLVSFSTFLMKNTVAQNSTFKLSEYKNPNYLYQSLDLNFGLNSGFFLNKNNRSTDNSMNSFSLNSGTGAAYTRYINSPKSQGDLHITFNAGIGSSNSTYNYWYNSASKEERKNSSFNHNEGFNIAGVQRFYNPKQKYLEVNGSILISNQASSGDNRYTISGSTSSLEETRMKNFSNSIAAALFIGTGRIEQIQDARMALYLLDDLYKLDREKRSVSDEDVLALAQLITSLKYKRFFDNRLRKIAEIIAIDSFMQQKGIAGNPDAVYFTSLNDNWDYSNNPVRFSGQRIFTGLEADFGYNYRNDFFEEKLPENSIDETTDKLKTSGLFIVTGITYEKPTSLKWQKSASFKAGIGIQQHYELNEEINDLTQNTKSEFYTQAFPSIKLSADYGFGYYPNSRTWLTFKLWLLTGWDKLKAGTIKTEIDDNQNNFYTYTGPQLQAYYYLSEKLRLSFTFVGELRYDFTKYTITLPAGEDDKQSRTWWNQQVNASLTYSLF